MKLFESSEETSFVRSVNARTKTIFHKFYERLQREDRAKKMW